MSYLKEKNMNDLWLSTCRRLAKIYLLGEDDKNFSKVIQEIKESSTFKNIDLNANDLKGISIYADIASIEIQFFLNKGDVESLREVNQRLVKNSVAELCGSDPKVLGPLKEAEARLALVY